MYENLLKKQIEYTSDPYPVQLWAKMDELELALAVYDETITHHEKYGSFRKATVADIECHLANYRQTKCHPQVGMMPMT